jgi:D-alanyl-lipoteichoic acid acyltransferase DltB (MBOAT superfamily)
MISPVIIGWIITVGGIGTGWLTTSLVALAAAWLLFMFMNSKSISKSMDAE